MSLARVDILLYSFIFGVYNGGMDLFENMVSLENLFACWRDFRRGKRKRRDVQRFERFLEVNIFRLRGELMAFAYNHGVYEQFRVCDPKERLISRASVRDRFVHHIVYTTLTTVFDPILIFHSLSCRKNKGVHKGISLLREMINRVSENGSRNCWALKMDIRRFFDTIAHSVLKQLIRRRIGNERLLTLVDRIIDSFHQSTNLFGKVGLPLGNVTSQLFANIYLHDLDDFIKNRLKLKFYLRYCDDFVILSHDLKSLRWLICQIEEFVRVHLRLELHPRKISLVTIAGGIDFVGYVHFPHHRVVRPQTKRRLKSRLKKGLKLFHEGKLTSTQLDQKLQSYLGVLSHGDEFLFSQTIKNAYWVR